MYDGDNDEKPTLRLRGGGYEVETVSEEENNGKTINHDDPIIDKDKEKEEERIIQSDTSINIPMDKVDTSAKYPREEPTINNAAKETLPNEIKALAGQKFTGDKLKTYGDAIKKKEEGML